MHLIPLTIPQLQPSGGGRFSSVTAQLVMQVRQKLPVEHHLAVMILWMVLELVHGRYYEHTKHSLGWYNHASVAAMSNKTAQQQRIKALYANGQIQI